MAEVTVVWDDAAVHLIVDGAGGSVDHALSRICDGLVLSMKYHCPVYSGPPRDDGRPSGTLRSSIRKFRQPDGSYLVGPTDMVGGRFLGPMIENGTPPHLITSHGPWPLRNRATGEVFGHRQADGRWVVHHPGTAPHPFIAPAAAELNGVVIAI